MKCTVKSKQTLVYFQFKYDSIKPFCNLNLKTKGKIEDESKMGLISNYIWNVLIFKNWHQHAQ